LSGGKTKSICVWRACHGHLQIYNKPSQFVFGVLVMAIYKYTTNELWYAPMKQMAAYRLSREVPSSPRVLGKKLFPPGYNYAKSCRMGKKKTNVDCPILNTLNEAANLQPKKFTNKSSNGIKWC
jgi:hypothetical protein